MEYMKHFKDESNVEYEELRCVKYGISRINPTSPVEGGFCL